MNTPTRTIVIVGGGFSGTTVAANLLRQGAWGPGRIVLVERGTHVARGLAYADRGHKYLLNVPAGRMSANSAEPLEFLAFAQNRLPNATADDFLPRSLYGEYLEASLLTAELSAPPDLRLERVRAEVSSIERDPGTNTHRLHLSDGRQLIADEVVLALGNPAPASPAALQPLLGSRRYAESPWEAPKSCRPGETVLVLGTSLTMADVVTASAAWCDGNITVHAISRHGLVPPSQTAFPHAAGHGDSATLLREASFSARRLMRAVRNMATELQTNGGDWREAITFVRGIAPALWRRMPLRERRRFLRHARSYWDIHRHRLPQATIDQLDNLRSGQKLHIHAGRLIETAKIGDKIHVTWRARGSQETTTLVVDRVINCTGPEYNPSRSRDPLIHSLLSQKLATADALNLGLRTGANGALIGSHGREAKNLYYVGPQMRADHWEATAAQELRAHAERLAAHLTKARFSAPSQFASPLRALAAAQFRASPQGPAVSQGDAPSRLPVRMAASVVGLGATVGAGIGAKVGAVGVVAAAAAGTYIVGG